jgi:hypothetical protein
MWFILPQSGFVSGVGDFTSELFPLLVGLVSVVWISVAIIAFLTIQDYLSFKIKPEVRDETLPVNHREAA